MVKKTKETPLGVKIISILSYIGAALTVLFGIALLFGASFLSNVFGNLGFGVIIMAIIMFAFAVLYYFIGKGLWNGQNWARTLVIIFAVLGVIGALFSLFSGSLGSLFSLIVDGLIAWYLLFHKEVKKFFK